MKKRLILRSEAEADLTEAYHWYEDRVSGLGSEFLQSVEAVNVVDPRRILNFSRSCTGESCGVH